MVGAHLTALRAQAQPVENGHEEGDAIETATLAQLVSHLSHDNARAEVRAATGRHVSTATADTTLPVSAHL